METQLHADSSRLPDAATSYRCLSCAVQLLSCCARSCTCSALAGQWHGVFCHLKVLAHRWVTALGNWPVGVLMPNAHHRWVLMCNLHTSTRDSTLGWCQADACVLPMTQGTSYLWQAVTMMRSLCMTWGNLLTPTNALGLERSIHTIS